MANITVIHSPSNSTEDFTVHATGCRDIKRETQHPFSNAHDTVWEGTQEELVADFNSDFDKETEGWHHLHFHPCAKKALRA